MNSSQNWWKLGFASWDEVSTSLETFWVGGFAIVFWMELPDVGAFFGGFGADLPALTQFVVRHWQAIAVCLFLHAGVHLAIFVRHVLSKSQTEHPLLAVSFRTSVGLQFACVAAFYAAIFKLGAVI